MSVIEADVVIVGAGMAGSSLGADLARDHRVVVIEQEPHAGFHATGRSAAIFSETYGGAQVRALSRASRAFLAGEDSGRRGKRVLSPRGSLYIARADQLEALDRLEASPGVAGLTRRVGAAEALRLCPILNKGYAESALHEPEAQDIDVDALHQGFLRQLRADDGRLVLNAALRAVKRDAQAWQVTTLSAVFRAPVFVNAAGAWADAVATLAGVHPLGITPMKRTVAVADAADGPITAALPLTIDVEESFYFRSEGEGLLISPADETATPAEDAQPHDYDVAVGIDRVERATSFRARKVRSRWAGLRSFTPDRTPAIGFEGETGFFWFAGQGGYGIQTAPAAAALAGSLIRGRSLPASISDFGVDASALSPARFLRSAAHA